MPAESNGRNPSRREDGFFEATRWSLVRRAQADSASAMGELLTYYRDPLLKVMRVELAKRGRPFQDAEDLLQEFLAHVLSREFLANVSQHKGAFRTFLWQCLRHFLTDQLKKEGAAKRGGGRALASLDEVSEGGSPVHNPAGAGLNPAQEFDRACARTVLLNALRRLEQQQAQKGKAALCHALVPGITGDPDALPYKKIGLGLGMSEGAVKMEACRMRKELKECIRDEIKETISNQDEWETELRYLVRLFSA